MRRMYDVWDPLEDRGNEFFSNFKYTPLDGFSREPNVSRRDPSAAMWAALRPQPRLEGASRTTRERSMPTTTG